LRAREVLPQWPARAGFWLSAAGEALPYEPMSPGNDVIAGRLRLLRTLAHQRPKTKDQKPEDTVSSSLVHGPSSLVIVAPIKALLQPTLSPAEWDEASTRL